MASILEWLDQQIAHLFLQWDSYTIILAILLGTLVTYSLLKPVEMDVHPMILARQAQPGRVRKSGESAVYRSPEVPHGTPLRSGLAVKLPSDKPHSPRRDGDLRYIWKKVTGEIEAPAIPGVSAADFKPVRISTALGTQPIVDHDIDELTREIAILGYYLKKNGSKTIALYLPNSIAFLSSLFGCAFFGLSVVLLPFNLGDHQLVIDLLKKSQADALIAPAGSLPLEELTQGYTGLKQVVWHVERSSRHMDWTEVPSGLGESLDVSMLHQVIEEHKGETPDFPELDDAALGEIIVVSQDDPSTFGQLFRFTHGNFVAAIAALISAVPTRQRINPSDVFFSTDSWSNSYFLCHTMAALFSGASLVITSVAGSDVDLTFAARNIAPTVVAASVGSAMRFHASAATTVQSGIGKLGHSLRSQTLAAGATPTQSDLGNIFGAAKSTIGSVPGTLRLLFIAEKAGTANPPISAHELNDLRIFTSARVGYALTAAPVAGAVTQTNIFDYRVDDSMAKQSHFGVPVSCLEIKLVDSDDEKTTDESARGEVGFTEFLLLELMRMPLMPA